jgi:hypothetical protein
MNLELIRTVLGWCTLFDIVILFVWWGAMCGFGGMIHRLHGRFFKLTREQFDAIHYALMGVFKMGALLLHMIPWLVLHIVG